MSPTRSESTLHTTSARSSSASVVSHPFVTRRRCAVDPLAVYSALRPTGACALHESADLHEDPALCSMQRSILVPRALLRFELRAEELTIRLVDESARPFLARLVEDEGYEAHAEDKDALRARAPIEARDQLLDDEERLRGDPALAALRRFSQLIVDARGSDASMAAGAFGALAYDFVDRFEELPPRRDEDAVGDPDAVFVLASDALVFSPALGEVEVITRGLPWEEHKAVRARHEAMLRTLDELASERVTSSVADDGTVERAVARATAPKEAVSDTSREDFHAIVEELLERVHAGDVFQAVPSRGLRMQSTADSLAIYRALRVRNPSPYLFHFVVDDGALLGASPETFLRVEDACVELGPIAGTAPRGLREDGSLDVRFDERLALSLSLDPKEQAEHAMLVDLARNDVARVSEPGSTRVVQQLVVEKFAHVQHLVSRVRGRLRPGLDAFDAYRVAANPGTLTGAPKLRAMQRVRALERGVRGFYGGAFGYFLADGRHDSCIVIRSLRTRGEDVFARVGAGVVADSVPEREWQETEAKSLGLRYAIADAELEALAEDAPREPRSPRFEGAKVLVVDHEDSFVFNLVDELCQLGCEVRTVRGTDVELERFSELVRIYDPELVVLSPGPGTPDRAGVTLDWLATRPARAVLGVCLGHQAIAQSVGGRVERAPAPVHGRGSALDCTPAGAELLDAAEASQPFVARYHSLVVRELPDELETLASVEHAGERLVMAMRHRELPWFGVQFHPESQLSPYGPRLLSRVLEHARAFRHNDDLSTQELPR